MTKYLYKKKRKICVITTTRADYGQLKNLILLIKKEKNFLLQVVVSGTHLSKKHGYTIKEIYKDKIKINYKINLNLKDSTKEAISFYSALALQKFTKCFKKLKPDIILVLGDRYEIFSATSSALFLGIPTAHLHGGEITSGVIDESLRHAITKMSDIHFASSIKSKMRIIRMGEDKKKVFNVGALTVENIQQNNFLSKHEIEKKLNIKFKKNNFLVAIHPVSSLKDTCNVIRSTLFALQKLKDTFFIFTSPNSDAHSNVIESAIKKFVNKHSNSIYFKSLGYKNFLSCIKATDGLIGNSSSGLLEAPILKTLSLNIGDRQDGRPIVSSVICCDPKKSLIIRSINTLLYKKNKKRFKFIKQKKLKTKFKIISVLKKIHLQNIKKKRFIDNI